MSKIIFKTSKCDSNKIVEEILNKLITKEFFWIWTNEKNEYETFLASLDSKNRNEIIKNEILREAEVFEIQAYAEKLIIQLSKKSLTWKMTYLILFWFLSIYKIHINTKNEHSVSSKDFKNTLIYRLDKTTRVLWTYHKEIYLSCIFEVKMLNVFRVIHDQKRDWKKQDIFAKLREFVYWSLQFDDVEKNIKECLKCVRYESVAKSQLLHSVRVQRFFQLIEINFIESLFLTSRESKFLFHVIDYFSKFFVTIAIKNVNVTNVISYLKYVFIMYVILKAIYCDQNQHFDNFEMKNFLKFYEVSINFSSFEVSQNIKIIELKLKNKLLQKIGKENHENWEKNLNRSIQNPNFRIIQHLKICFSSISIKKRTKNPPQRHYS